MGDLALTLIVLFVTLMGFRRGFFREFFAVLAFVLAIVVAIRYHVAVAPFIVETLGLEGSPRLGFAAAAAAVFVPVYLVAFLLGRRVVSKLYDRRAEERAEARARGRRDTGLTGSAALIKLDRLLGVALGLAKSAILVGIILYAATAWKLEWYKEQPGKALRQSIAMNVFTNEVAPTLRTLPEIQVARKARTLFDVLSLAVEQEAARKALLTHPEARPIIAYPGVRDLTADESFRSAVANGERAKILRHPKLLALLVDRQFLKLLATVDLARVEADLRDAVDGKSVEPAPAAGPEVRGGPGDLNAGRGGAIWGGPAAWEGSPGAGPGAGPAVTDGAGGEEEEETWWVPTPRSSGGTPARVGTWETGPERH
jgi:uncharacterized membrane protein required for colicin V production